MLGMVWGAVCTNIESTNVHGVERWSLCRIQRGGRLVGLFKEPQRARLALRRKLRGTRGGVPGARALGCHQSVWWLFNLSFKRTTAHTRPSATRAVGDG